MNVYYYIKLKSIEYDQPDRFLSEGTSLCPWEWVSLSPKGIAVFDDLDKAIDIKKILQEYFNGFIVDIVRF